MVAAMHIALLSKLVRLAPTPPTRYPFCSLTGFVCQLSGIHYLSLHPKN